MTHLDRMGITLCLIAILASVATLLTDQWPATYVLAGFNVVVSVIMLNLILRAVIRERDTARFIAALIFGDRG